MPIYLNHFSKARSIVMVLGFAALGQGCGQETSTTLKTDADTRSTVPEATKGGQVTGGAPRTGGEGGSSRAGNASGAVSTPKSGTGGNAIPGSANGGSANGGSASGGSAGTGGTPATDGRGSATGGSAGSGGSRVGSGGTTMNSGSGGSTGPNRDAGPSDAATDSRGSNTAGQGGDSNLDALTSKDTVAADLLPIPDASIKLDALPTFWTASYTTNCAPPTIGGRPETDGHHRPGEDCMRSGCHLNPKKANHHAGTDCRGSGCHNNGSPDGSGAPAFLFGGTVYRAGTLAADPKVEIGVKTTSAFYSACSASNGNFWYVALSGTTSLSWSGTSTRLRNANGEAAMMSAAAGGCNATACHTGTLKMTSP